MVGVAADDQQAVSLTERTRPDLVLIVSAHGDRETRKWGKAADPVRWPVKSQAAGMLLDAVDKALLRSTSPLPDNVTAAR